MTPMAAESGVGSPAGIGPGEMRDTRLPNGVRVLSERIPGVRSVTTGVWIRQGGAHETSDTLGASHLLEHLVFKGTERRTPKEIAMSLERLGGSLDAFTSREHTSFQAKVLADDLPVALDVLSDLVRAPLLRDEDLALEREVVLEEISAMEDTPDDLVFELHGDALWQGHPYGRCILGTRDSVESMQVDAIRALHRDTYLGGQMIVGAAGCLDHDEFADQVARQFGSLPGGSSTDVPGVSIDEPGQDIDVARDGAQTHLVFGARTTPRASGDRFPLVLLSAAFGGGMGSRLFQRVREELALAYTVFSYQSFYSKAGVAGVYVGTRPEWADRAVDVIREEYRRLAEKGLSETELAEVKGQVKGQVMLSLESTGSRLFRLVGFALYDEPLLTLDQLLSGIDAVTRDRMSEAAARFYDPERQTLLRLGPDGR